MINVELKNHDYEYDITQLLLVFFDEVIFDKEINKSIYSLENSLDIVGDNIIVKNELYKNNELIDESTTIKENKSDIDLFIKNYHKRIIKYSIYKLISKYKKSNGEWGILTGMRPVKVVHKYIDALYSKEQIKEILKKEYLMSENKTNLIVNIAYKERKFIYPIDSKKISIYISIPFCITRCTYCSFPSNIYSKKKFIISEYIKNLKYEIEKTLIKAKEKNLIVDSIYFGGGTPSTLTAFEMKEIFLLLEEKIDMTNVKEYTFEAGRPDTIKDDKLRVMKEFNITRICLNPQTMDNNILKNINRNHTKEDILEKFDLIKSFNFNSINMDLILGLPNQTIDTYKNTLEIIKKLKPDNITVHSLAIKKGSKLCNNNYKFDNILETEGLMEYSKKYLNDIYKPYYLYRQKNIVGNLENIGFSINGKESLYNIKIIEERHTILAFGAGAVSKIVYKDSDRFDRVPNLKGVEEYIKRIDEMVGRKLEAIDLIVR
jgi:oxygen-independent coproporphyrinogen-3 oxidase